MTERRTYRERRSEDRRSGAKLAALRIDFSPRGRSSPWAARVLFAVAAAVALDAGLAWHDARKAIDANQAALARLPAGAAQRASKEEVAAARDTVARLTMPWHGLFGALEAAASDQVTLLAVEPDPKAGKVTISGEGKDYLAALSYVLNLSRSDALSGVQLVRHEVRPDGPVAFSIAAVWREGSQ
jgi:hypothetical protein